MEKNNGIHISGGQVSAGAMAAGHNATAMNTSLSTGSLAEARAEMTRLLELLRAQPELADQTIAMAEIADHELGKEEPDKGSVLRLLDVIASGAKSIGGAVIAVQQAVAAIL